MHFLNKIGVIGNIVHPLTSSEGLDEIIESVGSKAIILLDILSAKYADIVNSRNIPCILCSNSDYVSGPANPAIKIFEKVKGKGKEKFKNVIKYAKALSIGKKNNSVECHDGSKIAVYLHGGGTTGKSKTIMLSSNNLNNLSEKLNGLDVPHKPGDEYSIMVLPMFHAFGLGIAMHFPITHGFTTLPMPQFNAETVIKYMKKHKVTFLLGVPNMYKKLMETDGVDGSHLKNLRLVFCGGDVLPERLVKDFNGTAGCHI